MFWAFLFLFDFRIGLNGVKVDILPDFVAWILIASAIGWILDVHSDTKTVRTISLWLVFLSIFDFVEVEIPFEQIGRHPFVVIVMIPLGIITLILTLVAVWLICGIIIDMAQATGNSLIRQQAELRRKVYLGFAIAVYMVVWMCFYNRELIIPAVLIGLPLAIVILCLMMGLMKSAAEMCRRGFDQSQYRTDPDSAPY